MAVPTPGSASKAVVPPVADVNAQIDVRNGKLTEAKGRLTAAVKELKRKLGSGADAADAMAGVEQAADAIKAIEPIAESPR